MSSSNTEPATVAARQERIRAMVVSARIATAEARARGSDQPEHGDISRGPLEAVEGYEIVRELHRGGQGIVFQAIQKSTRRTVAIKVMKEGPFAGAADRLRFDREVRILAQLNHRNIVGILDRGIAAGSEFLVMDYVEGLPLDRHARNGGLPLEERLRLFTKVCDAINSAHQRGVIHRDLKPGNILVDAAGEPRILDFGLARVADQDDPNSVTMTGQFMGSLPWASPEQAHGRHAEVDVRSDVYSLGVLLYQLLTDRFPYSTIGDVGAVLNRITSEEPIRPRSISRQVDEELETIVLKSLAKEPARRYQSVGELARDIRHYLCDEPIEAKRDSLAYVLSKTISRHRVVVGAAALFLLVLFGSGIAMTALWRQASGERDLAIQAGIKEKTARELADAEAARATAVNDFLQKMLSLGDPGMGRGDDVSIRTVVDESVRLVDNGALAHQPRVEAAVRITLGQIYDTLSRLEESQRHLDRSLALLSGIGETETDTYADALHWRAVLHRRLGEDEPAETRLLEALQLLKRLHPGDHPLVARTMTELAIVAERRGQIEMANALGSGALEMMRRILGPAHPQVVALECDLAFRTKNVAQARELMDHALDVLSTGMAENTLDVARAWQKLAGAMVRHGDRAGARVPYERALTISRQLLGDDHPNILPYVEELAFLYRMEGEKEQAIKLLREFLAAADKTYGIFSRYRIEYLVLCAEQHAREGDFEASDRSFRDAIEIARLGNHTKSTVAISARLGLIEVLLTRGKCTKAAELIEESWAIVLDEPTARTPAMRGKYQWLRGEVAMCLGEYQKAEALFLDGMTLVESSRMAGKNMRRKVAEGIIRLYQKWDAAEPGTGKDAKVAEWKNRLAAVGAD